MNSLLSAFIKGGWKALVVIVIIVMIVKSCVV